MQNLSVQCIVLLFFSLFLDFIIGDPRTKYHPVCLMGNFAYRLENFLRKGENNFCMFLRGAFTYFLVLIPSICLAILFVVGAEFFGDVYGTFLSSALVITFCMAPKSLADHAKHILIPLENGDMLKAREKLSMIVGRDVQALDSYGIARASIESVSENLVDGVLSTLFWASVGFFCFGYVGSAALAVMHRTSNILDAQWGKKNEKYIRFGTFSARMDDVLNYIPARLALPCICISGIIIRMFWENSWKVQGKRNIFRVAWKYRFAHASPNSAWSEAAFAAVLNIKLGGPVTYAKQAVNYPFIGEGTSLVIGKNIRQSIGLLWLTTFLCIFSLTLLVPVW